MNFYIYFEKYHIYIYTRISISLEDIGHDDASGTSSVDVLQKSITTVCRGFRAFLSEASDVL